MKAFHYTFKTTKRVPGLPGKSLPLKYPKYDPMKFIRFFGCMLISTAFFAQPCGFTVTATPSVACPGQNVNLTSSGPTGYTWTGTGFPGYQHSATISVGPGNYTLFASNGPCADTLTFFVGQAPAPVVQVLQSASLTCITNNDTKHSKPIVLDAAGASSYVWLGDADVMTYSVGPQTTVRPSSATCFTVIGYNSQGCSDSAVACVTVIPQFTITVTPKTATVCANDVLAVNIENVGPPAQGPPSAFTATWTEPVGLPVPTISNPTLIFTSITPQSSAIYTAALYDAGGCISLPLQFSVTVNPCLTVGETVAASELVAWPNPSEGITTISLAGNVQTAFLTDLTGRIITVYSVQIDQTSFTVELPAGKGMYILQIRNKDGSSRHTKLMNR